MLLDKMPWVPGLGFKVQDNHMAILEDVYEAAVLQLMLFYKGARDEIFLDMFEDEYRNEDVGWSCMRPGDSVCVCVCLFAVNGGASAVLTAGGLYALASN